MLEEYWFAGTSHFWTGYFLFFFLGFIAIKIYNYKKNGSLENEIEEIFPLLIVSFLWIVILPFFVVLSILCLIDLLLNKCLTTFIKK